MKHLFFFQITPQIDFQIHPVAVTATSEIISEPITTPQDVSKPIVKTTPPKGQLISESLFDVLNFPKNQQKN